MLSSELCGCSSDLFLSSRPRPELPFAYTRYHSTGGMVKARSINGKRKTNTHTRKSAGQGVGGRLLKIQTFLEGIHQKYRNTKYYVSVICTIEKNAEESNYCTVLYSAFFQHAHFIPMVGVGKERRILV